MRQVTLKETSFAAAFAHLPPAEARDKCLGLRGQADLCFDAYNWKEYVARRYRRKYAVSRPDLTTAEEWFNQALLLETYFKDGVEMNGFVEKHIYLAINFAGQLGVIKSKSEYLATINLPNQNEWLERLDLRVLGLPLVKPTRNKDLKLYLCRFRVLGIFEDIGIELVDDIDELHPSNYTTMFEDPSMCHQLFLELLIPYYTKYIESGSTLRAIGIYYYGPDNNDPESPIRRIGPDGDLNSILTELKLIFDTPRAAWPNAIKFKLDSVSISLIYMPSIIFQE